MENNEERCCGNCAFMIGEDICGYGSCPFCYGELKYCGNEACNNYIDKDVVRHSAAILVQYSLSTNNCQMSTGEDFYIRYVNRKPTWSEIDDAIGIVARYINVITKEL